MSACPLGEILPLELFVVAETISNVGVLASANWVGTTWGRGSMGVWLVQVELVVFKRLYLTWGPGGRGSTYWVEYLLPIWLVPDKVLMSSNPVND